MSGERDCRGYALGASCECPTSTACPLTPVPPEVAETTAGEREVEALLSLHRQEHRPAWGDSTCICGEWSGPFTIAPHPNSYSNHLAASIAALLDRVRREEGERIAQAIEGITPAAPHTITPKTAGMQSRRSALVEAARIARAASVGRDHP